LAELLLPLAQVQYLRDIEPAVDQLETLHDIYSDRASALRKFAADATAKAQLAAQASKFFQSENAITIGIIMDLGISSSTATHLLAIGQQFNTIQGDIETYAKEANELATRYEFNAGRAQDYKDYLVRILQ
jgi:hypothetical protein